MALKAKINLVENSISHQYGCNPTATSSANAYTGWTRDNYGRMDFEEGREHRSDAEELACILNAASGLRNTAPTAPRIFINGKQAKSYTFKLDYYWMMAHRHNSADSRYWCFAPSIILVASGFYLVEPQPHHPASGICWNRLFTFVVY